MRVFKSTNEISELRSPVVTIGTFDGVHRGHMKIIERIKELAAASDSDSVIITFHPHPRLVINPEDTSLKLLTTIDERIALLEKCGIDAAVVIPFSRDFSEQSPEYYIENFLVKYFHPSNIIIGYDHKFGRDRKGDYHLLDTMKSVFGYQLHEIPKHTIDDVAISSTKIRNFLIKGEINMANELLGYNYSLTGVVVKGLQNGRKLGYPTANIQLSDSQKLIPGKGIYAAFVYVEGVKYGGMLSIGNNPTFGGTEISVEVNILDFNRDIYGQTITIELLEYIRSEKKFESMDALIKAIDEDKVNIVRILY